ncbi:hypothetical protein [Dactylosporangium matsuzakiense]|uniref:Uncharacterized protein n=1 Tax=Dactylosporangium matsuzakiense TaxID=53360 RepID=A0A9W6KQD0_9ACTN|nr:hypothetical protein [Dactylosporangium matsuzakiense]UWZ44581.1 hypothetical protein Dmats_45790 [Dactylosporangium matsuzakiense]GLL05343.1 hypothetical protein GCM10017581_070900 [Dactylosporangium matsuzakiense]
MTDYRSVDPSEPRGGPVRRWFRKVLRNILGDDGRPVAPPHPVPPVTDTVSRTERITFSTPAKGDAYDFTVVVELCICATGWRTREQLDDVLTQRLADLTAEIKAAARLEARKHPIFRPGAAEPRVAKEIEAAARLALVGVPDEHDASLQARTRVRVDMPDAVRDLQRQMVDEQVKLEARYEHSEQAALRLGELRDAWSRFIKDGLPEWNTPYAVHMALNPNQAATTLYTLRKDRKDEAEKLVDVVGRVTAGVERMDLLDFVYAHERALRKTHELLGIPIPPAGAETLYDEPEEEDS